MALGAFVPAFLSDRELRVKYIVHVQTQTRIQSLLQSKEAILASRTEYRVKYRLESYETV